MMGFLVLAYALLGCVSYSESLSKDFWTNPESHAQTFVFAVPLIFNPLVENEPRVIITTTSLEPVDVLAMVVGDGFEITTSVTRYVSAEIALPISVRVTKPGIAYRTVVVKSSDVISVHCIDNDYESGDGFLALPNSQLGNKHYIMSYVPFYHEKEYHPAFLCVSAAYENTLVEITTKLGQKHQVALGRHESYRYEGGSFEDLTGTLVESTNPVSVISGVFTRVPQGTPRGADGLLEQIPPVDSWGKNFVLAPFLGRPSGYVYRVLAGAQSATIDISNRAKNVEIQSDEWFEGDVIDDVVIRIKSDQPVLVFQYMKSNQPEELYEPAMMMVPPTDSYMRDIVTFPVFNCTFANDFQYNIHVIVSCAYTKYLTFDNKSSMSDWEVLTTEDKETCVVRGNVKTGVHTISNSEPSARFTVAVYGLHRVSSYAYPAGVSSETKGKRQSYKHSSGNIAAAISGVIVGVIIVAIVVVLFRKFFVVSVARRRQRTQPRTDIYSNLQNVTS